MSLYRVEARQGAGKWVLLRKVSARRPVGAIQQVLKDAAEYPEITDIRARLTTRGRKCGS